MINDLINLKLHKVSSLKILFNFLSQKLRILFKILILNEVKERIVNLDKTFRALEAQNNK